MRALRTMSPRLAFAATLLALSLAVPRPAFGDVWSSAEGRASQYRSVLATSDGVRATLYRYLPPAGPPSRTILLLPDVGMTRHAFDFDGAGLAPFLQSAGWEVYVVEWRGTGRSEVPFGGYTLEDLLDGDAEAAFARASLERSKIAVGGVGMGATFALSLAARHADKVSAVLALQPLVAPDLSSEPLARAIDGLERSAPWLSLSALTRSSLFGERTWFELLYANDGSFAPRDYASLRQHVLAPVSRRALRQLADAARTRTLTLGGKGIAEVLRPWAGPTLLVFAPRDNVIHPEFAVPVRDLLPKEQQKVLVLDALANLKHDYGHLGMLLGKDAPAEVFGPVSKLLDEAGGPR
ncbi:MAG: alpha/beta hydrolase [Myxococcales bacterium]